MSRSLFVLLGAGASKDCTTLPAANPEREPPLVTELFADRFEPVLRRYPMAQVAAAEIKRAQAQKDPRTLEQFIADRYRDGPHPNDRRKYFALTYYLQELLWEVSANYTHHPDNYDLLIHGLEGLEHVVYVTLNYDTLLDSRLEIAGPTKFTKLRTYISPSQGFSLVKLHGSINWGYGITTPGLGRSTPQEAPGDLAWSEDEILVADLPPRGTLERARLRSTPPPHHFFPALSVPLGADDLISCPPDHRRHLADTLETAPAIDLLVIGYSGFDREVIKFFRDTATPWRSLFVVNRDRENANAVRDRMCGQMERAPEHVDTYGGTFGGFVQHGDIDQYTDWINSFDS